MNRIDVLRASRAPRVRAGRLALWVFLAASLLARVSVAAPRLGAPFLSFDTAAFPGAVASRGLGSRSGPTISVI